MTHPSGSWCVKGSQWQTTVLELLSIFVLRPEEAVGLTFFVCGLVILPFFVNTILLVKIKKGLHSFIAGSLRYQPKNYYDSGR